MNSNAKNSGLDARPFWAREEYPSLTTQQESDIFCKARDTDNPRALETIIRTCVPYVLKTALHYHQKVVGRVSLEDLQQAGIMGAFIATLHFDPTRGVRFKTYAKKYVKGAIIQQLYEANFVRITKGVWDLINQVRDRLRESVKRLSNPQDATVFDYFKESVSELKQLKKKAKNLYLKRILETIALEIENALDVEEKSISLDARRTEILLREFNLFLTILSPHQLEEGVATVQIAKKQEDTTDKKEKEKRRIRHIVLMEIARVEDKKKRLALVLYPCWKIVRKEITKDKSMIPEKLFKEIHSLNLPPDLLKKEKITQKEVAAILGVSTVRINQIVKKDGPKILRRRKKFVDKITSSNGEIE